MRIGLHVSIAGGAFNAPLQAAEYGTDTFQIFTRSPRGGKPPVLTAAVVKQFKDNCKTHGFTNYYVHTPYFINFASGNTKIKHGSISIVREELERASKLGVKALMTHLGSSKDFDLVTARKKTAAGLSQALKGYTGSTQFLIELAAGAGLVLGSQFDEVAEYIKAIEADHKHLRNKIGVCLDTCHVFATGYDIRTKASVDKMLKAFDKTIGLKRLGLIHANDSKTELGSRRDRHEHIGKGKIGQAGFEALIKHPKLKNIDFIIETHHDGEEKNDLKLLQQFRRK